MTGWHAVLLIVATQVLQMIRQLPPLLRFDGYHVLADLTGVPDLYQRIGPILASLWPTRWGDPCVAQLKWWARWSSRCGSSSSACHCSYSASSSWFSRHHGHGHRHGVDEWWERAQAALHWADGQYLEAIGTLAGHGCHGPAGPPRWP